MVKFAAQNQKKMITKDIMRLKLFVQKNESTTNHPYLDSENNVTMGIGHGVGHITSGSIRHIFKKINWMPLPHPIKKLIKQSQTSCCKKGKIFQQIILNRLQTFAWASQPFNLFS